MDTRLITAARAAAALENAARRADTNGDRCITPAEIKNAQKAGKNSAAATAALLEYHAMRSASVWRDPEIPASEKPKLAALMSELELSFAVEQGQAQLARIDTYAGTSTRAANAADGVVTASEVRNYDPATGKYPREAGTLARYASVFNE